MTVLCLDMTTYHGQLTAGHRHTHRLRRIAASLLVDRLSGRPLAHGKRCHSRGLLAVATALANEDVRVLYLHPETAADADIEAAIRSADAVCVYVVTPLAEACLAIARKARELNPRSTIALGGPHIASQGVRILTEHLADLVCIGHPSPQHLARAIVSPLARARCPGIAYVLDGKVVFGSGRSEPAGRDIGVDYSILPFPVSSYHVNTTSSYGCSKRCRFCSDASTPILLRPIDAVLSETAYLAEHLDAGAWVHFFDSTFTRPHPRSLELCRALSEYQDNLSFSCNIAPGTIDPETVEALSSGGFRLLSIGFETADSLALRTAGRSPTFEACRSTAVLVKHHSPKSIVKANWMLGLPGSTEPTIRRDIDVMEHLIDSGTVDLLGPKFFIPYPGTPFFETPDSYGLKIWTTDWSEYDRFHTPPPSCPDTVPRNMMSELLLEAESRVLLAYCRRLGMPRDALESAGPPGGYSGDVYGADPTASVPR